MNKTISFLSIMMTAMVVLFGCESLKEEDNGEGDIVSGVSISSIEQQIEEIKTSLPKLRATLKSLEELSKGIETKSKNEIEVKSEPEEPKGIKQYILMLEERIEALEEYVYSDISDDKEWLDMTYATLDMYEETVSILAMLQGELYTLKSTIENLDTSLCKKVEDNIAASITSMKDWVNELLTGYYDISAIDAKFAVIEGSLSKTEADLLKEIGDTRTELRESLAEMEKSYKDAIADAIEKNNGIIEEKIANAITEINSRIDKEVADINKRLSDIEDRIGKLEDSVDNLLNRIQSIAYIPLYEDNKARVNIPSADMSESYMEIDFKVSPRSAVNDIATRYQEFLSIKVLPNGTTNHFDLPITSCNGNSEDGILQLTVDCKGLGMGFRDENQTNRAILYISDGNNDLTSEYIELTQHFIQSEIRYTTTQDFSEADVKDLFSKIDAEIISTSFDSATNNWVTVFNKSFNIPSTAFYNKEKLVSISIPEGVKEIGESAFYSCYNLTQVHISESVTDIEVQAFSYCPALESITLPQGITAIESRTFESCWKLKHINIPESITYIKGGAFSGCHALESIILPQNIVSIEGSAFNSCYALKQINIPESITAIGESAFSFCI